MVDAVTLVVTALIAGAGAGVSAVASTAVADAYETLKLLVAGCFRRGGMAEGTGYELVARAAEDTQSREALSQALAEVDVDEATVQAAQRLLDLLERGAKFQVDASQAKGVIVGDHATQHNTFN